MKPCSRASVFIPVPAALSTLAPANGPVFAWAGSLLPLTAAQVQAATDYQRIPVDAQRLASADLVARVVQAHTDHGTPLRRMGIAGGDTSSHAVQALQLWGLSYQAALCPGVTLSRAHSPNPARHGLELMLKGGQMGGTDLFARLLGK